MHGVASPSLGPVNRKRQQRNGNNTAGQEDGQQQRARSLGEEERQQHHHLQHVNTQDEVGGLMPPLDLARTTSSGRNLISPRMVRRMRKLSMSNASEYSSYSTFCANLGDLTVGTESAESQVSMVFGANLELSQLAVHASEGDSDATIILDILEVLETSTRPPVNVGGERKGYTAAALVVASVNNSTSNASSPSAPLPPLSASNKMQMLEAGVKYISKELLPALWSVPDTIDDEMKELQCQHFCSRAEQYMIVRIVVSQANIVFQQILTQLDILTSHLGFWEDLEERPIRSWVILCARQARSSMERYFEWGGQDKWRSLKHTILSLEDLLEMYLSQLGGLKELLLKFEELQTPEELIHMTYTCIQHIISTLNMNASVSHPLPNFQFNRVDLLGYCLEFPDALDQLKLSFQEQVRGYEEVPRYMKYWPEMMACGLVGVGCLGLSIYRRTETIEFLSRVSYSWTEFFVEHVKKPLAALVDEIVFDHTLKVADAEAMIDAKQSLGRMLRDYVTDIHPDIEPASLDEMVQALDVSIISRKYETELKKPITSLVSGDLVRMLLIQMQFLKKELLVVMTALDELIRENQFNLEVMATVPAFVVTWSIYQLALQTIRAIKGTKQTKTYVFQQVRLMLRDVEQLLNLNSEDQKLLRGVALGRLVLLLHQLEDMLVNHSTFFDRHERKRLAEDVSELLSDHLTIQQKQNTILRMYRCYLFLQPTTSWSAEALLKRLPNPF